MSSIRANGITIEYESRGTGAPLVLIAGLGYDRWMWHRMTPLLVEHYRVITFDSRGVGGSDKPKGPYSAAMLAADTVGLLNALGIESAAVMGHSMGGFVAQALALDYPHTVERLILSATNFGGPNHVPISPEALVVLMDTRGDPVERLRNGIRVSTAPGFAEREAAFVDGWLAYRAAHPIDPEAYAAQLAVGLALMPEEAGFEQRLAGVSAPALILCGEHDKVVPPENATLLARRLPNSTVAILPGAGHLYPFEVPQAAAEAVIDFLDHASAEVDGETRME
jgi:pimeloyl-ACP methyl ester carboxylesterase